jgi:hypothetical protein
MRFSLKAVAIKGKRQELNNYQTGLGATAPASSRSRRKVASLHPGGGWCGSEKQISRTSRLGQKFTLAPVTRYSTTTLLAQLARRL